MNPWRVVAEAVLVAGIVVFAGLWAMRQQFSDRVPAHTHIGAFAVGGMRIRDVPGAVAAYEQDFLASRITIRLRGRDVTHTLAELGIGLNKERAITDILAKNLHVLPVALVSDTKAQGLLEKDFADILTLPKNPTIAIRPDYSVTVVPGAAGERIDILSLNRDIAHAVMISLPAGRQAHILASTIRAVPEENVSHTQALATYAQTILDSGFSLGNQEEQFPMQRQNIAPMLRFTDVSGGDVTFDEELLRAYLNREIASKIYRDPVNARFEMQDGRVSQFALPQDGEEIDIGASVRAIQQALTAHENSAQIVQIQKPPIIRDVQSTQSLGITSLLARGETDFKGSPKNRIHNIETGAARYHGLVIAPGQEFSFNQFLGPVTEEAGFKPELVIKNNRTTPEFGGGLCQVSTTMFRAAVYSGMKITSRRNHSYAVRYYGTPGFDATIYPSYTDFRFLNNTPGYILIQTKIDGTHLSFELWGTDDGREVTVDGPHPYDKRPDGAVKATLKQTVTKDGKTMSEDIFRSNYKSPKLFPKV